MRNERRCLFGYLDVDKLVIYNVLSIATRLRIGRSGIRNPVGARDLPLLRNVQTGSGVHPASNSMGIVIPS
jgi:hypothetical protein